MNACSVAFDVILLVLRKQLLGSYHCFNASKICFFLELTKIQQTNLAKEGNYVKDFAGNL